MQKSKGGKMKQENKGQNIAYIRISTLEQNTESQFEILKQYKIDKYFEEKISAKIQIVQNLWKCLIMLEMAIPFMSKIFQD